MDAHRGFELLMAQIQKSHPATCRLIYRRGYEAAREDAAKCLREEAREWRPEAGYSVDGVTGANVKWALEESAKHIEALQPSPDGLAEDREDVG